jgi:hypothetical protein
MENTEQRTNTRSRLNYKKPNKKSEDGELKSGRTLLVKSNGTIDKSVFDGLEGLQNTFYTMKSNSYFLTFETSDQSYQSLQKLKLQLGSSVQLKFAHYRVYFTISGMTNDTEYNTIKSLHTGVISKTTGCNVLYYRLYRKNDTYLGCGDMTLDTKEAFDQLMNGELLKNFTLGDITGTHYRYNKTKIDSNGYSNAHSNSH